MDISPVAYIHTEFSEKFGIPRQSGLAVGLRGRIIFEKEYRNPEAIRGLEGFSHIWLIWGFSANRGGSQWQPTVRPPRLGGNQYMNILYFHLMLHLCRCCLSCRSSGRKMMP